MCLSGVCLYHAKCPNQSYETCVVNKQKFSLINCYFNMYMNAKLQKTYPICVILWCFATYFYIFTLALLDVISLNIFFIMLFIKINSNKLDKNNYNMRMSGVTFCSLKENLGKM